MRPGRRTTMQIDNEIFPDVELGPGEKFTEETNAELSDGKGEDDE